MIYGGQFSSNAGGAAFGSIPDLACTRCETVGGASLIPMPHLLLPFEARCRYPLIQEAL
jgi:hypothetical protein